MRALKISLYCFFISSSVSLFAQNPITLNDCIEAAFEQHQYKQHEEYLVSGRDLKMKSSALMNLPQITLDGTATIQNEQISIPISAPIPGFDSPEAPLNFNRLLISFNQTIYNGGLVTNTKRLDSLRYDEQQYQLEIQKTNTRAKVTSTYGAIVLINKQLNILEKQNETLITQQKQVNAAIEAGILLKSEGLVLEAERLKVGQRKTEIVFTLQAYIQSLSQLTGLSISSKDNFELPQLALDFEKSWEGRPEFKLLAARKLTIDAEKKIVSSKNIPYVGMFGSLGLGYPGYNIFDSSIRPMAMAGLKLSWKPWDWGLSNNQKQLLTLNQQIINTETERYQIQFAQQFTKQSEEIKKFEALLLSDTEIINVRTMITKSAADQLKGGTTTSTQYLIELNKESVARLDQAKHQIQLEIAKLNFKLLQGE